MDQTHLAARLVNLLCSPLWLCLSLLLLPLIFKHVITSLFRKRRSPSLPPGPRPWPIIGNLHQIGRNFHVSITQLAKVHGPLISLRLGTQVLVIASSPMAAKEILKTHDRFFSGRPVAQVFPYKVQDLDRIALVAASSCNEQWKFLRTLCKTELFSAKAVESQVPLREKKVRDMVEFLSSKQGQVVDVGEVVFTCVFNTISNLLFSKDLLSFHHQETNGGLKSIISELSEVSGTPNIADLYPVFAGLDPQGLRKKFSKCFKEMYTTWKIPIKERRETYVHGSPTTDFLDVFLANGFDDDQINWLALDLFLAGSDTITTTVEWAVSELLRNSHAMKRVREELDRTFNRNWLKESDTAQLHYLNACVKETLRFHPPFPIIIRRALEAREVMNYTVPKDAKLLVNAWAIGRDPSVWRDPLSFDPNRFLDSNLDFKGQDFELLAFGSGKRMCAGLPLASRQLHLILGSLIHYFDWSLPNGENFEKLDLSEKFGLAVTKEQPLLLVPKRKL